MPKLTTSEDEAKRMLKALGNPLVEIRALPAPTAADPRPSRGYFDDLDLAAEVAACTGDSEQWTGIYVTVNRIRDDLRPLAGDSMSFGKATKDHNIDRFQYLVLDIDPIKPEGVKAGATDAEHAATLAAAEIAKQIVAALDWPEPMIVDSGNGAYVIFRVDLPNTAESKNLLERTMRAFAEKINNPAVKVDTSVKNASRVFRLAGTINRKGEHSKERPHRMAYILSAAPDDQLATVSLEQLEAFAKTTPPSVTPSCNHDAEQLSTEHHAQVVERVEHYLRTAKAPPFSTRRDSEFTAIEFAYCPFKGDEHQDGRSAVLIWQNGNIGFQCFHDKCQEHGWQALQDKLGMEFDGAIAASLATAAVTGQTERRFNDPVLLAQAHMKKRQWPSGEPTTVFFQGDLWRFDEHDAWQKTCPRELTPWLRDTIQQRFDDHARLLTRITGKPETPMAVRGALLSDTYRAMESLCRRDVSVSVQPPFWLKQHGDWLPGDLLVFRNGILNVRRYVVDGRDYFIPLSPSLFYEHQADFDFDPNAPEPVEWHGFLRSLGQDADWLSFLQEIMGYCLWSAHDLQKYFVLLGPPRSGKGTIAGVLRDLLGGPAAVCSPNLKDFAEPFGLEQAVAKRLALVPEIAMPENNAQQIVSSLKAITGGDMVTVNRKHVKNVSLRLPLKIIMLTNHFVALPDNSGALQARMLPLRLTKSFVGQEDPALAKKLASENAGILCWALEGVRRLYKNGGRFTIPQSTRDVLEEHMAASAPVQAFVEECCEVDLRKSVQSPALYAIYKAWFGAGDASPLGEERFSVELRTAVPGVTKKRMSTTQQRQYNGHPIAETEYDTDGRAPLWVGICPKPEWARQERGAALAV